MSGNEKYIYTTENTIDNTIAKHLGIKIYLSGTIIFLKIGEVIKLREVRTLAQHCTFDNNLIGVIPYEKKVDGEYLHYYTLGKLKFTRLIIGSTIPALRKSLTTKIMIASQLLDEQKCLPIFFSTVDLAIDKVKLLVERAERLKKELMQELLTKGIGHKEFQETPIGKIPEERSIVRLNEIAIIIMGKSPPSETYNNNGEGLPFL